MKIAIVGTGAMGSVYASLLGKAGHEVWAIDTWQEHIDAIAGSGPDRVGRQRQLRRRQPPCRDVPRTTPGAVTSGSSPPRRPTSTRRPRRSRRCCAPDSVVMAFQNGLGAGERVARRIPDDHIVIGIAEGFGSSIPEPGHVHHEGMRLIRIGEMNGGLTDRVVRIERAWRDAGFNVKAFADVHLMIWEKFLCNVTLSAPCAVFDVTVGELMANPETWKVALGCAAEAYRLGLAKGIAVPLRGPAALCDGLRRHHPERQPVHAPGPPRPSAVRRSTSSTARSSRSAERSGSRRPTTRPFAQSSVAASRSSPDLRGLPLIA